MRGLKLLLFFTASVFLMMTMVGGVPGAYAQTAHDTSSIAAAAFSAADKHSNNRHNTPAPKISYEKASQIALSKTGGGYVKEIDLEYKHRYNRLVYEVEVRKDYAEFDLDIDAETGEVLKFEKD